MLLSTRMRYGSRVMIELAAGYPGKVLSAAELARLQNLSAKYLEQILRPMRVAGFIRATRGNQGGYALARDPGEINLYEIYSVLDGPLAPTHCIDHPEACPFADTCPLHETWTEMKDSMADVLQRTTLRKLLERRSRKEEAASA